MPRTDCTTAAADGFPDLLMRFDAQALREALELTGSFEPALGGAPIVGEDVVITLTK